MAEEWFFSRAGKEYGPCSGQDLKKMAQSGQVVATDLVWKEGMAEWVPASTVKGLLDGAGAAAAPSAAPSAAPTPAAEPTPAPVASPLGAVASAVEESASPYSVGQTLAAAQTSGPVKHSNVPEKFRRYLSASESVLYASNPSKAARVISMVMAGFGGLWAGLFAIAGGPIAVLIVWLFTVPIAAYIAHLRWKHQFYIITSRRIIVSQGIFNVSVKILPNQNITMISVNTGIIDRWLGLNSIELASAGAGGGLGIFGVLPGLNPGNVTLRWIANAPQVVSLIRV